MLSRTTEACPRSTAVHEDEGRWDYRTCHWTDTSLGSRVLAILLAVGTETSLFLTPVSNDSKAKGPSSRYRVELTLVPTDGSPYGRCRH